jgi:hypothetical protein
MTPVQAAALPLALAGRDLIAQAKTGSGKTAAFALPLLAKLNPRWFSPQALVLCPTRELADQVAKEIRRLARATDNIKVVTLCGGAKMGPQIGSLEHGAHVAVGTPGRIMDHLERGTLDLRGLNTLVLDEADRMLDMGFFDDITYIAKQCPARGRRCCSRPPSRPASKSSRRSSCATRSACRSKRDTPAARSASASSRSTTPSEARCGGAAAAPLPPGQHAGVLQHQGALPRAGRSPVRAGLRGAGTVRRHGTAGTRPGAGALRASQLRRCWSPPTSPRAGWTSTSWKP